MDYIIAKKLPSISYPMVSLMIKNSYKIAKQLSLCCSSLILLSLVQGKTSSQDLSLLKRVKEHWKEGDYSLAKKQIQTYLNKNPTAELSEELHLLLGDIYFQEGNFTIALEEYNQIERTDLLEKAQYNKALCLYENKKIDELYSLTQSTSFLLNLNNEEKNSILYLTASSLFTLQKTTDQSPEKDLLNKARILFEECLKSNFAKNSLPLLAEIYILQKENARAANCYLALASENPSEKADLTSAAALLLADTDPSQALELIQSILPLDSAQKAATVFNCIVLEYQLKQFKEVVDTYKKHESFINSETERTTNYLVGKSLYYLTDYKEAPIYLLKTLEDGNSSLSSKKTAYLMLLDCAYKTQNIYLYKEVWKNTNFLTENTDDPKIHLAYLDLLKLYEKKEELIEESRAFLAKYPENLEEDKVHLNLTYALYDSENWEQTESLITDFLEKHSNHPSKTNLLRLKVNCASKQLQNSSSEKLSDLENHWIAVLENTLENPGVFSSEEKENYQLELIKNLFKKEQFSKTLETIEKFQTEFSTRASNYDVQLMKALCYLKDPEAKLLFALHAEKLLQNYEQNGDFPSLRLHLFNTYLKLADESLLQTKNDLLEKAANHLFYIFQNKENPIKDENIKWLTDYYYKNAEHSLIALDRANLLLEHLVNNTPANQKINETTVYKLCKILSYKSENEKKLELLDKCITANNLSSNPETNLQKELFFELAKTSQQLGKTEKALDLYDTLIRSCDSSLIGAISLIERSKLLFTYMKTEEKTENNPVCLEILSNLKDLEMRLDPLVEPICLEAGLEYITCKTSLSENQAEYNQKTANLFRLFKDTFSSSPLYTKENLGEKWTLVDAYMKFAELEILRLDGLSLEDCKIIDNKLKALEKNTNTPESLKNRIQISRRELSENL